MMILNYLYFFLRFTLLTGRELAFRKPTTLSTTLESDIIQDGCFSTQVSENPYWMVDLRYMYRIQRILIHFPSVESTRGKKKSAERSGSVGRALDWGSKGC